MEKDEFDLAIENVKEEFVRIINESKLPMTTISSVIKAVDKYIDIQMDISLRAQYKKNMEVK